VFISTDIDPTTGEPLISRRDQRRHHELFEGISPDGGATWTWTALTADSTFDNIRPVVPRWDSPNTVLVWLRGTYRTYTDYDLDVVGIITERSPDCPHRGDRCAVESVSGEVRIDVTTNVPLVVAGCRAPARRRRRGVAPGSISRRQFLFGLGAAGTVALTSTGAQPVAAVSPRHVQRRQRQPFAADAFATSLPDKAEIISVMRRVNDHWIDTHPQPGTNGWERATYFEGNLAAYHVYPDPRYLDYAIGWGEQHGWGLAGGVATRHADNQCAGQTYIDLFRIEPRPERIATVEANLETMLDGIKIDDWTWVDAIHMAMPVFARLGAVRDDPRCTERLYEMYQWTKRGHGAGLYNPRDGLWWRDAHFKPPVITPNGHNVYWSRGNGWALAAHVRTLAELPTDEPHRAEYVRTFQTMAAALADLQRPDGFWGASLHDDQHQGGPETSGTAFFVYGMAWGVRHGLLDPHAHLPVMARAWRGLTEVAVHPDGGVGFVQPPGDRPIRATFHDHHDYGVGAFLLACSELVQLAPGELPKPVQ
jgi:unsaturated rhamnogalacturonyl hydrolase